MTSMADIGWNPAYLNTQCLCLKQKHVSNKQTTSQSEFTDSPAPNISFYTETQFILKMDKLKFVNIIIYKSWFLIINYHIGQKCKVILYTYILFTAR